MLSRQDALDELGIDVDTISWPTSSTADETSLLVSQAEPASLTGDEWAVVCEFLPADPSQTAAMTNREFIDAVLWTLAQRKTWTQISGERGEAIRKRFARWAHAGTWQQLYTAVRDTRLSAARQSQFGTLANRAERMRQGVLSRRGLP